MRAPWRKSVIATVVAMCLLGSQTARAGGIVTDCTDSSLRAALAGGGTVTFACDCNITLTGILSIASNTLLDGGSYHVTISGGDAVPVLHVNTNVVCTVAHLTITNGRSYWGAGIYNDGGRLTLRHCVLAGNTGTEEAGALGNYGGEATLEDCTLACNTARKGGAIANYGSLEVRRCTFSGNWVSGEWAYGGAIYNEGMLAVESSLIRDNTAVGTDGAPGDNGGEGIPGGNGGPGGDACGGFFNRGTASIVNSSFAGNWAHGGRGGQGGSGGIIYLPPQITDPPTPPQWTYAPSGDGGDGGEGIGAIQDKTGLCFVTNCTFVMNWCDPDGGWGGFPGCNGPISPGRWGADGIRIGAILGCRLVNTVLAANTPVNGSCFDLGHNLSSDASCAFTNAGSLNDTDPKLGPLANNGGNTLTMALLPGSPAIDAGDEAAAPADDQRGFPRPVGEAPDLGAFEYGSPALLTLKPSAGAGFDIFVLGKRGQPCWLLASETLLNWQLVGTNQFDDHGTMVFHETGGNTQKFYRVLLP